MSWQYHDTSITSLPALVQALMRDPAKLFIRNADGRDFSYGAFRRLTGRIAGALVQAGVKPGDRVAVQVEKSPEVIALFLACARRRRLPAAQHGLHAGRGRLLRRRAEPRVIVAAPAGSRPCRTRRASRRRRDAVARHRRRRHADGGGSRRSRPSSTTRTSAGMTSSRSSTRPARPGGRRARC